MALSHVRDSLAMRMGEQKSPFLPTHLHTRSLLVYSPTKLLVHRPSKKSLVKQWKSRTKVRSLWPNFAVNQTLLATTTIYIIFAQWRQLQTEWVIMVAFINSTQMTGMG